MLVFHHLQTLLSENIVVLCFQSHGVLLMNYQESVCHAMGVTRSVKTGTLPSPCCSAETKLWLQTRFCNPCLKAGCTDGGQKSGKLLRKINIKKVFGFLKPNFRVYNTSSFRNVESVQGLFSPERQVRGCLARGEFLLRLAVEQALSMRTSTSLSALLEIRRLFS